MLIQEVLQLFTAAGVAQLTEGLRFDLADSFPGDIKLPAYLLQGPASAILKTET